MKNQKFARSDDHNDEEEKPSNFGCSAEVITVLT
jgi:hypothetical protein